MDRLPPFVDSLLHLPSAVVLAVDEGAEIRWISQSVESFLGFDPESLVGKVALDLVDPADMEDLAVGLSIISDHEMALADRSTRILNVAGQSVEVRLQPVGMVPGDDGPLLILWLRHVDLERKLLDTFRLLAEGAVWDDVVSAVLSACRQSDGVRLSFHRWNGPDEDRTAVAPDETTWGEGLAWHWLDAIDNKGPTALGQMAEPAWCSVEDLERYSPELAEHGRSAEQTVVHLSPVLVGSDDPFGLLISWYSGEVSDAQRHLFARHDGLRASALRTAAQRDRGVAVLRAAARTDPLTGLANRTGITESLGHHRNGVVLFVDLDRFKPINDRLGHRVGDLVLEEVGQRIRSACRNSDVVGRLGGDEFVVVAPGLVGAAAADLRGRLIATLNQAARIDGHYIEIRATVGMADISQSDNGAMALDRADADMLERKPNSRRRVGALAVVADG